MTSEEQSAVERLTKLSAEWVEGRTTWGGYGVVDAGEKVRALLASLAKLEEEKEQLSDTLMQHMGRITEELEGRRAAEARLAALSQAAPVGDGAGRRAVNRLLSESSAVVEDDLATTETYLAELRARGTRRVISVWQDGTWQDWGLPDAEIAACGPNYLVTIPIALHLPPSEGEREKIAEPWRSPETKVELVRYEQANKPPGPPSPPLMADPSNGQLWRFDMAGRLRSAGRITQTELAILSREQEGS